MAEFRALLHGLGLQDVRTYIQSGNAVFCAKPGQEAVLREQIESQLEQLLGSSIHVFLYAEPVFRALAKWPGARPENAYFVFLKDKPQETQLVKLQGETYPHEDLILQERMGYLHCREGMGKAKLNNALIEKKLGTPATTRNSRTVDKLLEICSVS